MFLLPVIKLGGSFQVSSIIHVKLAQMFLPHVIKLCDSCQVILDVFAIPVIKLGASFQVSSNVPVTCHYTL